jgi:hypothetical protein
MARSAAERQRAYRERRLGGGAARLDNIVSANAIAELGRLAQTRGVTRSQALEQIIAEAAASSGQPRIWRDKLKAMGVL